MPLAAEQRNLTIDVRETTFVNGPYWGPRTELVLMWLLNVEINLMRPDWKLNSPIKAVVQSFGNPSRNGLITGERVFFSRY
ncbi:hypothetical protein CEE69_13845 [Rhodopirellula bahusiensis]|uniref:Uncharacterized protein n=1 Tax=Rhodopirellula bahusiensis TaxID=2014065 RepID=A0A2G1W7B4_9BACT|nr:hypothetical protein CEE69_13845 [Rhodopirellula bahusiensis]